MHVTDEELLKRCGQGDVVAFEMLYRRYSPPLYRYIVRIVGDGDVADDLFQESFVRILAKAKTWRPYAKASTWFYTIATNLCYSELRRRKRHRSISLGPKHQDIPATDNPRRSAERSEIRERVDEALGNLSDNQRIVFSLRHDLGLSYAEIAAVLCCPIGTVKSRVHAAVVSLRHHLQDLFEEVRR